MLRGRLLFYFTVKEVYVGAGGVKKVWPSGYYLLDGDMSNWKVIDDMHTGSDYYNMGSVESYGLQISSSYSYNDWYSSSGSRGWRTQLEQFYNSSAFPDTLDNYTYVCIEYNAGNPSTGDTTNYSQYLQCGISFRSQSGSKSYYWIDIANSTVNKYSPGTYKFEISSSQKSNYNKYMTGSYDKDRFNVGGWNSEKTNEGDDYDERWIYYNSGYISAVWLEE